MRRKCNVAKREKDANKASHRSRPPSPDSSDDEDDSGDDKPARGGGREKSNKKDHRKKASSHKSRKHAVEHSPTHTPDPSDDDRVNQCPPCESSASAAGSRREIGSWITCREPNPCTCFCRFLGLCACVRACVWCVSEHMRAYVGVCSV